MFGKEARKVEGKIINLHYQGGWKSWVNLDVLSPSSFLSILEND